jgi:predicted Zn-dependent peptidase
MITKPQLPENEIDSIRSLLIQDIKSLPDQPSRRVAVELSKSYFPHPFNRSSMGTEEGLQKADLALLTKLWTEFYKPDGSLLSIAGKFDEKNILNDLEKLFSNWQGKANGRIKFGTMPKMQKQHIPFDGAQLQIAMAFPSAPFGDKDYYSAKLACGILSGGMFGRLFIDVREKRGLCYSVYARHSATKDYGQVYAYAGTTPERAHETLDVMLMVFNQLKGSITQEELDRARANVLTAIIMSEESPGSRASSNSTDWWVAGELRTLDQIKNGLKAVTIQDINNYLERFPIKEYALTTLGAKDITKEH